jgi:hypothetical protein
MKANQKFSEEIGIYHKINLNPLSSNSVNTA